MNCYELLGVSSEWIGTVSDDLTYPQNLVHHNIQSIVARSLETLVKRYIQRDSRELLLVVN